MTKTTILLSLLLGLLSGTPALAQFSKINGIMNNIKGYSETLNDLYSRKPLDEPKIHNTARQMRDAFKSGAEALASFGEPLAAAAASPHEERLREPFKLAQIMAYLLGREMTEKCDKLISLINTDVERRGSNFQNSIESEMIALIAMAKARVNDWEDLTRKSAETMRWLRESLQTALAMREDSAKPGAALDAAKRQLETKQREQNMEVHRYYEIWKTCQNRELEAGLRYNDARNEHEAARLAPPSSSYTSNFQAAYRKWIAAELQHKEAARQTYEALTQLLAATTEARSRLAELARLMGDLEKFQESANPETIARRIADFDRWTTIWEREMSR